MIFIKAIKLCDLALLNYFQPGGELGRAYVLTHVTCHEILSRGNFICGTS